MAKIVEFIHEPQNLDAVYYCYEAIDMSGEYVSLSDYEALQAENARLREELKSMLNIFDRALPDGSIGRMTCDKAKEVMTDD